MSQRASYVTVDPHARITLQQHG